ncbi:rhamnogalacturonan acetylesterase [Marinoscillum sp. MHG1-6]|uniref:rhamnogalacturonan acetylesterase n=1 Tax=Marinoscillum sp. MHG1-6 TaxID=2959627 RepID=UPI0021586A73|nr:rhamnogalacturonan acetylesterase [Marinoscillum sp. MHG1-6]
MNNQTRWPNSQDDLVYGITGDFKAVSGCQTEGSYAFWVKLEEGNYRIKFLLGDSESASSTTIKAESRRLMVLDHVTKPGQMDTVEVVVNVRTPNIDSSNAIRLKARELDYLNWDSNLTIEVGGECPSVKAIEIEKCPDVPTIFLAGNSTVVDQEKDPWASWGQMLPLFLKPEIAVANFAESGETLRSFIAAGRLKKIESLMKPGDYLFVEFAHNDQKPGWTHVDPYTTYDEELMKFVGLSRDKGVTPVLVTSTNRRRFDNEGKILNTLEEYPESMRKLASKEGLMLIDLNAMSKTFYETLGIEGSKKAFVHYEADTFPWQEEALADNTHFSTYGAWQLAKCVVKGINESGSDLARFVKSDFGAFDPSEPDDFDSWTWPMTTDGSVTKPDGS